MNAIHQHLLESLAELLHSGDPPTLGEPLRAVDAFFAYRLLLGRNPDAATELASLIDDGTTLRQFLSDLVCSDEFARTPGYMPPDRLLMADLGDFRFWFNTSDRDMGAAMALGIYERRSVEALRAVLRPGMRCLDVGAQTGFMTCTMAAAVGPGGLVHAFEPMPASYALLERNVAENRFGERVRVHRLAASDVAGTVAGTAVSGMYVIGEVGAGQPATIEVARLDDLVDGPIDLVKLDVEGHEPAALRGMAGLIAAHAPLIVTEANEYWLRTCSGTRTAAYAEMLIELGYRLYDVERPGAPVEDDLSHVDALSVRNWLAVPTAGVRPAMATA